MTNLNLQQTIFHIEKLKSVVNVGRSTAYHIYTSQGPALGSIGSVTDPLEQHPANEAVFEPGTQPESGRPGLRAWLGKLLPASRR